MPHAIVLQPNGKYAIWSSVVDDFIYLDLTKDEIYAVTESHLKPMTETELRNIDAIGRGWDWSPTWNEALGIVRDNEKDTVKEIEAAGLLLYMESKVSELEDEKYWHIYWRNKAIKLQDELTWRVGNGIR